MEPQNISDPKTQAVINLLKQYDSSGLKFEDATKQLLAKGYSQTEINSATDYYQYGAPKPVSDVPAQVTDYFKAHPDQALEDGAKVLKAARKEEIADERTKAILDASAASAAGELGVGNLDAKIEYESKFANDVGVSFWLLFFAGLVINLGAYFLVIWLGIPQWFYPLNALFSIALVVLLIRRIR